MAVYSTFIMVTNGSVHVLSFLLDVGEGRGRSLILLYANTDT